MQLHVTCAREHGGRGRSYTAMCTAAAAVRLHGRTVCMATAAACRCCCWCRLQSDWLELLGVLARAGKPDPHPVYPAILTEKGAWPVYFVAAEREFCYKDSLLKTFAKRVVEEDAAAAIPSHTMLSGHLSVSPALLPLGKGWSPP